MAKIEAEVLTKTGECMYRDELGNLCLAESFIDSMGEVITKTTVLEVTLEEIE
jgi:hypothetical protein